MEQKDETTSLISASKVQGTNVYNTQGESLGEVYDVITGPPCRLIVHRSFPP